LRNAQSEALDELEVARAELNQEIVLNSTNRNAATAAALQGNNEPLQHTTLSTSALLRHTYTTARSSPGAHSNAHSALQLRPISAAAAGNAAAAALHERARAVISGPMPPPLAACSLGSRSPDAARSKQREKELVKAVEQLESECEAAESQVRVYGREARQLARQLRAAEREIAALRSSAQHHQQQLPLLNDGSSVSPVRSPAPRRSSQHQQQQQRQAVVSDGSNFRQMTVGMAVGTAFIGSPNGSLNSSPPGSPEVARHMSDVLLRSNYLRADSDDSAYDDNDGESYSSTNSRGRAGAAVRAQRSHSAHQQRSNSSSNVANTSPPRRFLRSYRTAPAQLERSLSVPATVTSDVVTAEGVTTAAVTASGGIEQEQQQQQVQGTRQSPLQRLAQGSARVLRGILSPLVSATNSAASMQQHHYWDMHERGGSSSSHSSISSAAAAAVAEVLEASVAAAAAQLSGSNQSSSGSGNSNSNGSSSGSPDTVRSLSAQFATDATAATAAASASGGRTAAAAARESRSAASTPHSVHFEFENDVGASPAARPGSTPPTTANSGRSGRRRRSSSSSGRRRRVSAQSLQHDSSSGAAAAAAAVEAVAAVAGRRHRRGNGDSTEAVFGSSNSVNSSSNRNCRVSEVAAGVRRGAMHHRESSRRISDTQLVVAADQRDESESDAVHDFLQQLKKLTPSKVKYAYWDMN
jgi:hypothetical protein